ncbi:MAG: SDR family oxidoreductase [Chloroflexi bacterium]|nr:SDR family oxidoreductase [Chloroflexota bacterium]
MTQEWTPVFRELRGRSAIVTGATAGIGESIARMLATNGVRVAVVGRNRERGEVVAAACAAEAPDSYFQPADVTIASDVVEMVRGAHRRFGRIDIQVTCAGGFARSARLEEYSEAEWQEVCAANLTSVILCCQQVVPIMKTQGSGRIVNVGSSAGQGSGRLSSALYAAAKAGVMGLTKHLSREVAEFGVMVNATLPGWTMSPRVRGRLEANPDYLRQRLVNIPVRRVGDPEEQAGLVLFLCSDLAGQITGACLDASGGVLQH